MGLVGADDFEDSGDLFGGEAGFFEDSRGFFGDVGYVVPGLEGVFVFGAVADEDAEIVEPDCGEDYVVVVGEVLADLFG